MPPRVHFRFDRSDLVLALIAALTALAPRVHAQSPAAHHPGVWTTAAPWPGRTMASSVWAVHMALLEGDTLFARPHSQMLAWGQWYDDGRNDGGLWAWNPTTDLATAAGANLAPLAVTRPPLNAFCAGFSSLKTGDGLIIGGTARDIVGEKKSARFDTQARTWLERPLNTERWYGNGTPLPSGLILATAGWKYDHMVLFGGRRESDNAVVSDVQRYAITNDGKWDAALTGSGPTWPEPREHHTLADQPEGPAFLFGGNGASGVLNDVWQLKLNDNDAAQSYVWEQINPNALVKPAARWRHAAVVDHNGSNSLRSTVYVHGGEDATNTSRDDLWKFAWDALNFEMRWTQITATGLAPSARSGHAAIWDEPNSRMILFGGKDALGTITDANVYILTIPASGTPSWRVAPLATGSPAGPAARTLHAMAADAKVRTPPGQTPGWFHGIVFGGERSVGLSNELWELYVEPGTDAVYWLPRAPTSPAPAPRTRASILLYEEYPGTAVVFGGELADGAWDASPWETPLYPTPPAWTQKEPPAGGLKLRGQSAFGEKRPLTALQAEVYDPATNAWTLFGSPKMLQSYHMMFAASDGMLYSTGPNTWGQDKTWRLNPGTGTWALIVNSPNPYDDTPTGVLYRPNKILKSGDLDNTQGSRYQWSLPVSASLQIDTTPIQWRQPVTPMVLGRRDHTLNMLPTGEVIATGGLGEPGKDSDPDHFAPRRQPEIWDPNGEVGDQVGHWYGASASEPFPLAEGPVTRAHHSTALLLPDGRVMTGGGLDGHPDATRRSVDQYSPPYLFRPGGAAALRPRLKGAQDHITWGTEFMVACPDPVLEASLIRPGSTTHAYNHDNRFVPLEIVSQDGHRVTLSSPPSANDAPPGNYLLFVLNTDPVGGNRVPSIARWVNVGETQTTYATWDTLPPAMINNLTVTAWTPTTHTLEWVAPSDAGDGSLLKATRYELRYRVGAPMATLDDFFNYGTRATSLPTPGTAGTGHSFTVSHESTEQLVYFRIISRDGAGSDRNWSAMSNEASHPLGGCPFVDIRTATGWEVENSILGRSLSGTLALDSYRLRHAPEVRNDRVRLRVRENEQELTTLDQLRLIAVDHEPGVRAYAVGDQVVLGTRSAAERVTTSAGVDITALLNGTSAEFSGGPGDTLLVEFAAGEEHAVIGEERSTQEHSPFHIDDGGKCPPDCGSPLLSPADPMSATSIDGQVLSSSGIMLQAPDGLGGWRTVLTRYPREHADEAVFEGLGHGPVRMVFVGQHKLRFVGRLQEAGRNFSAHKLPLLAARHSRFGDVASAMDTTGNLTSVLVSGDTVHLEFGWSPVPEGQVRELMLLSRGVYTANLPAASKPVLPERFAVRPNQPNPFSASTLLRFELPIGVHVRLEVLDAAGRRVRVLADRHMEAGQHAIAWDGRTEADGRAGPGVYFYRVQAGAFRARGRMTRVP